MNSYKIYSCLPVLLQDVVCSIYGVREGRIRFNKKFYTLLDELKKSDFSTLEQLLAIKKARLRCIILAAKHSGIYRELDDISESLIEEEPWQVLAGMPVLQKSELTNFNKVTNGDARKVITSGTTGKALTIWKDRESFAMQWAVWFRHRYRFGVNLKDLSVNFTGKPVVPISQKKPPFWRHNLAQNQILISMQHINQENIHAIVCYLNSIKPIFYSGYPSIISEVSRLATNSGLALHEEARPKVVFTGAENLLEYQRRSIYHWTGAVVTDQYGLTEGNCNFSKCEHGYYHEDSEFCHIEIVDGERLEDGAIKGRLIGTAFYNNAMPLIRYDTGDIAIMAPEDFKCPCGRHSRVIFSVDGRSDDYVITPDGRQIMRFDYLFKDTFEVMEAQVVQERFGEVEIFAVLSGKGTVDEFEDKVKGHFYEYISKDMLVFFKYVDAIPRSSTGKFKAVLNRLNER